MFLYKAVSINRQSIIVFAALKHTYSVNVKKTE